jgi:hypothetical protein
VQIRATSCSPETLRRLQRIFDVVWHEVEQQRGKRTFPWAIEATRFTIARLVLEHGCDLRNPAHIKREVLRDLDPISNPNRKGPQHSPLGAHSAGARTGIDKSEVRALLEMLRAPYTR